MKNPVLVCSILTQSRRTSRKKETTLFGQRRWDRFSHSGKTWRKNDALQQNTRKWYQKSNMVFIEVWKWSSKSIGIYLENWWFVGGKLGLLCTVVLLYPKGNSNSRKKASTSSSFVFYRAWGYICGLITILTGMSDEENTLNANAFLNRSTDPPR